MNPGESAYSVTASVNTNVFVLLSRLQVNFTSSVPLIP